MAQWTFIQMDRSEMEILLIITGGYLKELIKPNNFVLRFSWKWGYVLRMSSGSSINTTLCWLWWPLTRIHHYPTLQITLFCKYYQLSARAFLKLLAKTDQFASILRKIIKRRVVFSWFARCRGKAKYYSREGPCIVAKIFSTFCFHL